jgi:hypothetical protein
MTDEQLFSHITDLLATQGWDKNQTTLPLGHGVVALATTWSTDELFVTMTRECSDSLTPKGASELKPN